MKVVVELEMDSDNSQPGEAEISAFDTTRGEFVSIKVSGPEREIWIKRDDLERAIRATAP